MERRKLAASALVFITCLCATTAMGWAAPATSAADVKVQEQGHDALATLLDRAQVIKSAAEVTSQAYPNADLVQVDDFTVCEYRADGTGTTWSDNYTKVLTEKGRREQQGLSFGFMLPYNKVAVSVLELIKADGSIVPVDIAKQSKVMIDRSQMSSNIYDPNSKVLQVGVPGVEIGDVLHVVTEQQTMKRYMPDTWDDYQVFESTGCIKHAVYEVRAPKDRPLYHTMLKDAGRGHGQVREAGAGWADHPSVGGPRCAPVLRRAGNAAGLHGGAASAGQHAARLEGGLQLVLAVVPAAPGGDVARDGGDGQEADGRHHRPPEEDRGDLPVGLAAGPLHGDHDGERVARLGAARREDDVREPPRRLPR